MNERILIVPDDLRHAAKIDRDARAALGDVRARFVAVPPDMPSDLMTHAEEVLGQSIVDLHQQEVFLGNQADLLDLRADWAEHGDAKWPFGIDVAAMFGVSPLGAQFTMPKTLGHKKKKKGFWEQGFGNFLYGFGNHFKSVGVGSWHVVNGSYHWLRDLNDPLTPPSEKFARAWDALPRYDPLDESRRLSAIWAELTDQKDRDAGNDAAAGGWITAEALGLALPFLKAAKLGELSKAAEAATAERTSALAREAKAAGLSDDAIVRLANGPRWQTGEVPWQPTGSAPGRWASHEEFKTAVVTPAWQASDAASQRAVEAQHAYEQAQLRYDGWEHGLHLAERVSTTHEKLEFAAVLNHVNEEVGDE